VNNPDWDDDYAVTADALFDPTTDLGTPDYHFGPRTSITLHFAWDQTGAQYGSCPGYEADTAVVTLRHFNNGAAGTQVGTTTWTVDMSGAIGGTGDVTKTMYFDGDPFALSGHPITPDAVGQFYVGISLTHGGDEVGANTEGGTPAGNANDTPENFYTQGLFSTGFMSGFADADGASSYGTINTAVGKNMSLERLFVDHWDLPGTVGSGSAVDTAAAAGRGVVWSIKPSGTNFVTCSAGTGTSTPWESVAAGCNDTGTYGLTNILSQLDALGANYHVPMIFAIEHEPHNNTSDWGSGGVGSCVAKSTCDGSSSEYRAMYNDVHNLLGPADEFYPHVQLIYIAVDTNMSQNKVKATNGTCTGGTVAGCGDIDRPADTDYDLLGADVYNYFKWVAGGPASGTSTSGSWNDIASTGSGSSRVNIIAKMGTVASGKGDMAVAAVHQKHILMTELGTHPGCPGSGTGTTDGDVGHCATGDPTATKDQWFQNFASTLASDTGYQTWFEGFAYFNNNHHNSPTGALYDWQFVDRTGNPNNSESACPSGVPCWTGLTGYKSMVVSGTDANWWLNGTTFKP
jgi:hypothetical protein